MKNILQIVIYLLLSFVCTQIRAQEEAPKFCETTRFDGIFHFGIHLKVKTNITNSLHWIWTYDRTLHTFKDPPIKEDNSKDSLLLTSYYISDVQKCQNNEFCENADKICFYRERQTSGKEVIGLFNSTPDKPQEGVSENNYPWNLTKETINQIWPQQGWEQFRPRPSVYWPSKYEVLFITYSGEQYNSELVWNDISTIDWYKHLKRVSLNSSVHFVGMFESHGDVFAVGDSSLDGHNQTYVYRLIVDPSGTKRELINTNIPLRHHFRCEVELPTMPPTLSSLTVSTTRTTLSTNFKSSETIGKIESNENNSSATLVFLLIVIMFAIVLIILFSVIFFGFIKSKGTVTSIQANTKSSLGDSESSIM